MREGLYARDFSNEEGNRLLQIMCHSSGSVVGWRGAQVLLPAPPNGRTSPAITREELTSAERVRKVINDYSVDGFDSLYPPYAGGRPATFTSPECQAVQKITLSITTRRS